MQLSDAALPSATVLWSALILLSTKMFPILPLWEVVRRELSNSDLMKKHKKELLRRPIGIIPPKTRKKLLTHWTSIIKF